MKTFFTALFLLILVSAGAVYFALPTQPPSASIVVSTSMLECAVSEVIEGGAGLDVFRLVPPSSCPGHFDLSPRLLLKIKSAVMVVRHDYQNMLEQKIMSLGKADMDVLPVETPDSLLIPDNYLKVVKQVSSSLAVKFPKNVETYRGKVSRTTKRLEKLERGVKRRMAECHNCPVIASFHQKQFCQWLGLKVIGVLRRPEEMTPKDFEGLMNLKPGLVVANIQEGTQAAEALGSYLKVPVVVFSNFPKVPGYGKGYDELLVANLDRLKTACRKKR